MRRILFMTVLFTVMAARGQTYSYRYWFDNNTAATVSGSATGETLLSVDVSGLSQDHIHALRMQVYKNGQWSSVRTSYFLCPITATHQMNATGHYWFDNDISTVQPAPTVDGLIDLDVSGLKTGMHAVHYQTCAADGTASIVRTQYFLLTDYNGERLTCEFWIDDDKDHSQWLQINNNEVEVDISSLEKGNHNVTLCVYDGAGILTARDIFEFKVKDPSVIQGDVNADGLVNVTDIVAVVNYIMNNFSDDFVFDAADVNADGLVNVTDIVQIVNIIMETGSCRPVRDDEIIEELRLYSDRRICTYARKQILILNNEIV